MTDPSWRMHSNGSPAGGSEPVELTFADLFDVEQIQAIQDAFSAATGVASLITTPDGTPITRPSNFCRLCNDIIRGTEKGDAHCRISDSAIGRPNPSGPVVQTCLSGGLWDAGASIMAGGNHVANWLVGQVRNEAQDQSVMMAYADEIGADRDAFAAALAEVPAMSQERFALVAQSLFLIARELSNEAYQHLEQRRLVADTIRAHDSIRESRQVLAAILDAVPQAIFLKDAEGVYLGCNRAFAENAGLADPEQIVGKTDFDLCWPRRDAEAYRADDAEVIRLRVPKRHIIEQVNSAEGSVAWVDTTKIPLMNGGPSPYAVLGVFEDITERLRTEAALADSAERYQAILQAALDGFALIDGQGRFLEVNDAYCRITGYSAEELAGMRVADLSDADSADTIAARMKVIAGEGSGRFETRSRRKDGTVQDVEISIRYMPSEGGRLAVFLRDITDRRMAETALRDGYDMLVNLTDQVPGVVYQYLLRPDGSSCFPFSSRGMSDIYEYSPEDVRQDATPVFGRLHPEDYDRVAAEIAESARTLEPFHCEFRVVLPRQGLRWRLSDAIPHRLEDGSTLWYGIISDATDRVLAEEALHTSEDRLNKAQHYAHVGSWTWDIKTDRLEWSDEMFALFGLDRATFTGSLPDVIASAIHPDDRAKVEKANAAVARDSRPTPIDYRIVWPDGSVHVVWAEAGDLVLDAEGNPALLSGTVRDITEEKALRDAVARQAERIAQTLTSVIDIASTIVETRDPYTAGHQKRVADIASRIAEELGMSDQDIVDLRLAALIHDIGKVQVPAEILGKPGPISSIEYDILKTHAEAGFRIVASANMQEPIAELVHQHHERIDGSGYPLGLTGGQMHPGAKVLAVADVVEAMSSHRPYRPAVGIDAALAEIERGSGTAYDPDVATACLTLFREGRLTLA